MKTIINSNFEGEWLGGTKKMAITLKEKPSNEAGKRFIAYNELDKRIGGYDNLEQFSVVLKSEERRLGASDLALQKEVSLWMSKINKEVEELILNEASK